MQETMQDTAVERLSKLITDRHSNNGNNGNNVQPRKPLFRIHLGLEEGWFSLFLLAAVVYSTIWCVQAAGWVDHLNVLTLTTLLGLIAGVVAAKQRRLPALAVHLVATLCGLLLAFWQTAGAFDAGNTALLLDGMHKWFMSVTAGGTGEDDSIFLFFITALSFVLAYTSAWLLYRTRNPWLMIVANAVVLLINLSNIEEGYIVFLVVFLMASLLLLLRFNLYESVKRWRRQGLRYADDLGWDVMQAGALISIGILIFSWFLPWGYTNDTASQIWNADSNPWVQLEDVWNRAISLSGGGTVSNHGNFRDTLVLGGNPNLNNEVVFIVQSDDPSQYLMSLAYENYDGRGWLNGSTSSMSLQSNQIIASESSVTHQLIQQVKVVNPPGEQYQYLFGASQIGQVSQSYSVLTSQASNAYVAVLSANGKLTAGESYIVTSYVSSADEKTLRTVPMPANSPPSSSNFDVPQPITYYDPAIVKTYTQLPKNLDPNVVALARRITANAPTMYDKVVALENYLRTNYTYSVDINLPPGEEGASWFLFRSAHKGFCNYFATTMAVMARSLGIPSRVVAGYTNGKYDAKNRQRVITGTDAHSWTQVYFAGYGWINFEPSQSFASFDRPAPGQYQVNGSNLGNSNGATTPVKSKNRTRTDAGLPDNGGSSAGQNSAQTSQLLAQSASVTLGGLVLLILFSLILFSIWWQRLFRRYSITSQIYGRICLLANWAGYPIQRSQTPYEYINGLVALAPDETATLERFGDIYVRELWADPKSAEHPRASGEIQELPSLWKRLQPRFFLYLLRHPYFLLALPGRAWQNVRRVRARRRARRIFEHDL
ncbi:MAG: hypothetical protein NVS4B7_10810 [Ktedonobacteraceae bacterium]